MRLICSYIFSFHVWEQVYEYKPVNICSYFGVFEIFHIIGLESAKKDNNVECSRTNNIPGSTLVVKLKEQRKFLIHSTRLRVTWRVIFRSTYLTSIFCLSGVTNLSRKPRMWDSAFFEKKHSWHETIATSIVGSEKRIQVQMGIIKARHVFNRHCTI